MDNNLKGKELVKYLFEADSEDRYVRLIIPYEFVKQCNVEDLFNGDVNLIGKKKTELSLDEIVLVKKYAGKINSDGIDNNITNNNSNDINVLINKVEEKILDGKTPEEQQQIQKEWRQTDEENRRKFEEYVANYEKENEEWQKRQNELMSIDEIRDGLNGIMEELDKNTEETYKSIARDMLKGKSEEEINQWVNNFKNNIDESTKVIGEKIKNTQFMLTYENSDGNNREKVTVTDDYIRTVINYKINEYTDKERASAIQKLSLDVASRIKEIENKIGIRPNINDLKVDENTNIITIRTPDRMFILKGRTDNQEISALYNFLVSKIFEILQINL